MLEKFRLLFIDLAERAQIKLRSLSFSGGAMKYIIWYALLVMLGCMLYVAGWCADWYFSGKPDLVELRNFLHEIASAPWIALIGFIAKAFIDNNSNGVPDEYESEDDKK